MTREQVSRLHAYARQIPQPFSDAILDLLDEREALLEALIAAADALSSADEVDCPAEAAEARAAIAKAEAE